MKNVIIAALANNDIADNDITILKVKFKEINHDVATYWVLMYDANDNVFYITKVYFEITDLEADFAGQVDYEGSYGDMTDKFETL